MDTADYINISEELSRCGVLTPVIKKFIKFLMEYGVYESFMKITYLLRYKYFVEAPSKHLHAQDILHYYMGLFMSPRRYLFYDGYGLWDRNNNHLRGIYAEDVYDDDLFRYNNVETRNWTVLDELWVLTLSE